ncbi:hypothetical protein [Candidatus Neptunochlamydia vexilliferae]|uniref:Aspartyl protease n=1 Tax=Candidatus Neptunichlamydia vexilliferae TaxID=1651774 RepID=A0ABS0AYW4_9BACT|nr:hypothetical protein [Candidatus Neptunochlamydia vexilliferae]MBF5058807.1 hypothetical protein [Candidatus Neptunochlamydia vexilliferae]
MKATSAFFFFILSLLIFGFSCSSKDYVELPVGFNAGKIPIIEVQVENNSYLLGIDLGTFLELKIRSSLLESINKKFLGTDFWEIYDGSKFVCPNYQVPNVKIGNLAFKNVVATAYPEDKEAKTTIWENPKEGVFYKKVGVLGRGFFQKSSLLFDFKKSKVIISNNISKLKKNGYDLESFIKLPFTKNKFGILVNVTTDIGDKTLLLDTGFTYTMLHEHEYPSDREKETSYQGFLCLDSNHFAINGVDFGKKKLYFLKLSEKLREIDGFLGMDFIKHHVMYIDFPNKLLYIQPPQEKRAST